MKHRAAGASGAAAGDAALADLLRQEGAPYDLAGLRALVAGVLAAPPDRDLAAWTTLVVPAPSPSLRQVLLALAAELRAAARLAHRLHRLGRARHRPAAGGGGLRRWALHAAGASGSR